jgi:hypothetical protein
VATGQGTATIDFGAGSYEASVAVTGQTTIGAGSKAEAFVMGDDTSSDHTAVDHRWLRALGVDFTCGTPSAGVGFTIYGKSIYALEGTWSLRFVWAD